MTLLECITATPVNLGTVPGAKVFEDVHVLHLFYLEVTPAHFMPVRQLDVT